MLDEVYGETERKMKRVLGSLKEQFKTVRTGRASPSMLESVTVDYYGSPTPVNQLAKIQVPDPKHIVIQPYDSGNLEDIERGILESDLNLTPNSDGDVIRLNLPDLTEERREELSDRVREFTEDAKIKLRQIRREARDEVDLYEEEGEISEDDAYRARDRIQEVTDRFEEALEDARDKKIEQITSF